MFPRFVATWLILSILGYGMVLAADVHERTVETENPAQVLSDGDFQPPPLDQQADGDHCCHGIAHILGFTSQETVSTVTSASPTNARYSEFFRSLSPTPSLRPPINA